MVADGLLHCTGGAGNKSPVVDKLGGCSPHRLWPYMASNLFHRMSGSAVHPVK